MASIKKIFPLQVLDSRGDPTLYVRMVADNGRSAHFTVPAGASVGKGEAVPKHDDTDSYGGKGVSSCIQIINDVIAPKFIGYPLEHQDDFDSLLIALDGSPNKENLGANTILALSVAYFKLSAALTHKPLWQYIAEYRQATPQFPRLYANMVGGGKHAPGLEIQEFLMIPKTNEPGVAIEQIYTTYHTLQTILASLYGPTARLVGDEGAMAPLGASTEIILEAMYNLNSKTQEKFDIALDVAANSFYNGQTYHFENQDIHASDLMNIYQDWNNKFDLYSLEDPFAETDLEGIEMLKALPTQKKPFLIVGDDYTVTNAERITQFATEKVFDDIIIKPNQVGTVTEMFAAIDAAKAAGNEIIVSHRSGESNDDFIVDLAYGLGAFGLKLGAPVRGERVAKYNRLLEIEQNLNATQAKSLGAAGNQPTAPINTPIEKHPAPTAMSAPATGPAAHTIEQPDFAKDVQFGRPHQNLGSIATNMEPGQASGTNSAGLRDQPTTNNPATDMHNRAPFSSAQPATTAPSPAATPTPVTPPPTPVATNPAPPISTGSPLLPDSPVPNAADATAQTAPGTSFQSATQELNPTLRADQGSTTPPQDLSNNVPPLTQS